MQHSRVVGFIGVGVAVLVSSAHVGAKEASNQGPAAAPQAAEAPQAAGQAALAAPDKSGAEKNTAASGANTAASQAPGASALGSSSPPADGVPPDAAEATGELSPEEMKAKMKAFEDSLGYRSGKVSLANGAAELTVPSSFRYIGPEGTNRVLQAWGNPPDPETEGMLFTKELGPFDEGAWAVVIEYTQDGHVSDEDAEEIDFDDLLEQMKQASIEGSAARKAQGLDPVTLLGWAEPPHYDKATHKLYWAKELEFGDSPVHTLNYAIRVLGREGVLELNAVADMRQLSFIKRRMTEVITFAEFTSGNRYSDFDESTDKIAAYGIGALVAGSVAAKTGLLKGIFAVLLASKKLLVVGVVAAFAAVKAFFKRNRSENGPTASDEA